MLPASSPLKCMSPSDIYMLLKSSDFILHDLNKAELFDDCDVAPGEDLPSYELELVLRKWYPVDRSRELRCFVRRELLLGTSFFSNDRLTPCSYPCEPGISQRDPNYYDFWNDSDTQRKVLAAVTTFWEENIKGKWEATRGECKYSSCLRLSRTQIAADTFDLLLTRDLSRGHIIDFNPYAPKTDPLLFSYDELLELLDQAIASTNFTPEFRVVDSPSHPAATRNAPAHQHNMVPIEALTLSSGRDVQEFAGMWREEVARSAAPDSDSDDDA